LREIKLKKGGGKRGRKEEGDIHQMVGLVKVIMLGKQGRG